MPMPKTPEEQHDEHEARHISIVAAIVKAGSPAYDLDECTRMATDLYKKTKRYVAESKAPKHAN